MASWFTRRRTVGTIVSVIVIAVIAAGVTLRATQRAAAESPGSGTVALEFTTDATVPCPWSVPFCRVNPAGALSVPSTVVVLADCV